MSTLPLCGICCHTNEVTAHPGPESRCSICLAQTALEVPRKIVIDLLVSRLELAGGLYEVAARAILGGEAEHELAAEVQAHGDAEAREAASCADIDYEDSDVRSRPIL